MKYTVGIAMTPLHELPALAKTAEECGFSSIALPDSLFYMETQSTDYPYTPDGTRMWNAETPWVDPLIAAAAMGAVTSTIEFYTQVQQLIHDSVGRMARIDHHPEPVHLCHPVAP